MPKPDAVVICCFAVDFPMFPTSQPLVIAVIDTDWYIMIPTDLPRLPHWESFPPGATPSCHCRTSFGTTKVLTSWTSFQWNCTVVTVVANGKSSLEWVKKWLETGQNLAKQLLNGDLLIWCSQGAYQFWPISSWAENYLEGSTSCHMLSFVHCSHRNIWLLYIYIDISIWFCQRLRLEFSWIHDVDGTWRLLHLEKYGPKDFFFFSGLGFSISYLSRCQVSFISFLYQAGDDFDKDETLKTRKDFATAGV